MINLDVNKALQNIVVTVSANAGNAPAYILHLKSTYSKSEYTYELGDNISLYPIRFDEFEFAIDDLDTGEYTYQITSENTILEVGYARIINSGLVNDEIIYTPDTSADYFIYKG